MEEDKRNNIRQKSLRQKLNGFIIPYTILNFFFFFSNHSILNSLKKSASQMFHSNITIDGADFSIFSNLFAAPIFIFLALTNAGIFILMEFIAVFIFKTVYMKSMAGNSEDRNRLYRFIRIILLGFILANATGALIWGIVAGDLYHSLFFLLLYWPMPFFTFIFISSRIRTAQGS